MRLSFSVLRNDGTAHRTYDVEGDQIEIGRSESCQIVLDDDYVSGSHAVIRCQDETFVLCDSSSTNGTRVDGTFVFHPVPVGPDSVIEVGIGGPKIRVLSIEDSGPEASLPEGASPVEERGLIRLNQPAPWNRRIMVVSGVAAVAVLLVIVGLIRRKQSDVSPTVVDDIRPKNGEALTIQQQIGNEARDSQQDRHLVQLRNALDRVSEESETLRAKVEEQEARLEDYNRTVADLQKWATQKFVNPLSGQTRVLNFGSRARKSMEIRRKVISELVNLPASESTAKIWNGSGVNELLECLGPVAVHHERELKRLQAESSSLSGEQAEKYGYLLSLYDELLIPTDMLTGVQCEEGLTGQLMPVKLVCDDEIRFEMLPLDWPAALRVNKSLAEGMKQVASARQKVIAAAGTDNYAPARELQRTVDDLERSFSVLVDRHFQTLNRSTSYSSRSGLGATTQEMMRGKRFLRTLRYSIERFIAKDRFPEVRQIPVGSPHDDSLSLISILSAMRLRGLQFATASYANEQTRRVIFERMRDYYASLYSLSIAVEAADQAELEARIKEAWYDEPLDWLHSKITSIF